MKLQEFLLIVILSGLLLIGAIIVIVAARGAAAAPCEAPAAGWQPPDLRLCPDDMDLWNCIRDAAYRSDI